MDNIFGIGLPELVLILVIAGIVMGPERIGKFARWLGKTTAQLQRISRSFVQQLNNELDGVDDGQALKSAMSEVQALRQELESLRTEFTSVTSAAATEGKEVIDDIQRSIKPPSLKPPTTDAETGGPKVGMAEEPTAETDQEQAPEESEEPTARESNGTGQKKYEPIAPADLPNVLPVADDPE